MKESHDTNRFRVVSAIFIAFSSVFSVLETQLMKYQELVRVWEERSDKNFTQIPISQEFHLSSFISLLARNTVLKQQWSRNASFARYKV